MRGQRSRLHASAPSCGMKMPGAWRRGSTERGILVVDSGDDHRRRAELHKPLTREGIVAAARELLRTGLSDHDVAQVLKLDVQQLRRLVGESE